MGEEEEEDEEAFSSFARVESSGCTVVDEDAETVLSSDELDVDDENMCRERSTG